MFVKITRPANHDILPLSN
ncbi:hypothetical protein M3J09_012893 [Ascochyta lentis]